MYYENEKCHRLEDNSHKRNFPFLLITQNQPGRRGQTSGATTETIKSENARSGKERSGEIIVCQYYIFFYDSPYVNPIHVVPKKGGMMVVVNEKDELIPI